MSNYSNIFSSRIPMSNTKTNQTLNKAKYMSVINVLMRIFVKWSSSTQHLRVTERENCRQFVNKLKMQFYHNHYSQQNLMDGNERG